MRIRMVNSLEGPKLSLRPGDITSELPEKVMRALIERGDAVEIRRGMRAKDIELAVREADERAVARLIGRDRERVLGRAATGEQAAPLAPLERLT